MSVEFPISNHVTFRHFEQDQKEGYGAVVVVKWSASPPSTQTIRVRILLTTNFRIEKTKINEKEAVLDPCLKKRVIQIKCHL